jgi:hypothetical protein
VLRTNRAAMAHGRHGTYWVRGQITLRRRFPNGLPQPPAEGASDATAKAIAALRARIQAVRVRIQTLGLERANADLAEAERLQAELASRLDEPEER